MKMNILQKVSGFLLLLTCFVHAHRFCEEDEDCEILGDLICVKSRCRWGICGCKRDYGARMGRSSLECVKLRRVGQSCSEDALCSASSSVCDDGRCSCRSSSYLERFDGKACYDQSYVWPSETCGPGIGSSCQSSTCRRGRDQPLIGTPPTCTCNQGYQAAIVRNPYTTDFGLDPGLQCVPIGVGDFCFNDDDCSLIRAPQYSQTGNISRCVDNKCACADPEDRPSIDGNMCGKPLEYGQECKGTGVEVNSICDGSKGLVCGDVCEVNPDEVVKVCVCHHSWIDADGQCSKAIIGSACYGDLNCETIGPNAICVKGLCANDAARHAALSMPVFVLAYALVNGLL